MKKFIVILLILQVGLKTKAQKYDKIFASNSLAETLVFAKSTENPRSADFRFVLLQIIKDKAHAQGEYGLDGLNETNMDWIFNHLSLEQIYFPAGQCKSSGWSFESSQIVFWVITKDMSARCAVFHYGTLRVVVFMLECSNIILDLRPAPPAPHNIPSGPQIPTLEKEVPIQNVPIYTRGPCCSTPRVNWGRVCSFVSYIGLSVLVNSSGGGSANTPYYVAPRRNFGGPAPIPLGKGSPAPILLNNNGGPVLIPLGGGPSGVNLR